MCWRGARPPPGGGRRYIVVLWQAWHEGTALQECDHAIQPNGTEVPRGPAKAKAGCAHPGQGGDQGPGSPLEPHQG
eukprot:5735759-Alexandrium_andersonii.AAC.1